MQCLYSCKYHREEYGNLNLLDVSWSGVFSVPCSKIPSSVFEKVLFTRVDYKTIWNICCWIGSNFNFYLKLQWVEWKSETQCLCAHVCVCVYIKKKESRLLPEYNWTLDFGLMGFQDLIDQRFQWLLYVNNNIYVPDNSGGLSGCPESQKISCYSDSGSTGMTFDAFNMWQPVAGKPENEKWCPTFPGCLHLFPVVFCTSANIEFINL